MPTDPSTQAAVTTFARYLRTASLAIAAYDYLQTLPFEVRICREAWRNRRMSSSFIFFILIRYTSIFVLTISNVAYFGSTFTRSICGHFFLLPSVFKLLQAMVSQAILGFRAYNLSRKSRPMGLFLLFVFVLCITLESVTTLYKRTVMFKPELKNCASVGPTGSLGGWLYYVLAIIYDLTTTVVCMWYLFKIKAGTQDTMMARVSRMMLVDGLWYFVTLGFANFLCIFFYRITDIKFSYMPKLAGESQTAAASLGYTVRWVMSQKLIMHLYEAALERRNESLLSMVDPRTTRIIKSSRLDDPGERLCAQSSIRPASKAVEGGFSLQLTVPSFDESETEMTRNERERLERRRTERGERQEEEEEVTEVQVRFERRVNISPALHASLTAATDYSEAVSSGRSRDTRR